MKELDHLISESIVIYNYYRPHLSLNMITPNQMYESENRANCLTRFEMKYCQSISGQDIQNLCRLKQKIEENNDKGKDLVRNTSLLQFRRLFAVLL